MKLKSAFGTLILAGGLLSSTYGLAQSSVLAETIIERRSNQASPDYYVVTPYPNVPSVKLAMGNMYALPLQTRNDKNGFKQDIYVMTPDKEAASYLNSTFELGSDYNALIVKASLLDKTQKGDLWNIYIIAKKDRAQVTAEMANNPDQLKKFLSDEKHVQEVHQNVPTSTLQKFSSNAQTAQGNMAPDWNAIHAAPAMLVDTL